MKQEIIDLYDEYTHTPMTRRVFLDRLKRLTGSVATAAALLPLLEGTGAEAAIVAPDDPRLETRYVTFEGASGPVRGLMTRPKGMDKLPGVVVIHQNKGLTPHIEDVARRLALTGCVTLAPDALSPVGGAPSDPDKAKAMIKKLDKVKARGDFLAAISYLAQHEQSTGKVGTVGFCWGGSMVNQMAIHSNDLSAAVVYYGSSPDSKDVPNIKAPLLLNYAGLDKRIGKGVPAYEAALKAAKKTYTLHTYEGVNHAFNDDTRAARYDEKAAKLAWKRTVAFFELHLM